MFSNLHILSLYVLQNVVSIQLVMQEHIQVEDDKDGDEYYDYESRDNVRNPRAYETNYS
jgi:hypothetical protein